MMFIVRWPVALVLLLLALISLAGAALAGAVVGGAPIDLSGFVPQENVETLRNFSWLEIALWAGAGLFFLIAMIRLLRRTQAFWTWLIAFALYGGRWAVGQQSQGGLEETAQSLTANSFQPEALTATPEAPAAQVTVLAAILIVGLVIFLIDAADRHYWDKQGA